MGEGVVVTHFVTNTGDEAKVHSLKIKQIYIHKRT